MAGAIEICEIHGVEKVRARSGPAGGRHEFWRCQLCVNAVRASSPCYICGGESGANGYCREHTPGRFTAAQLREAWNRGQQLLRHAPVEVVRSRKRQRRATASEAYVTDPRVKRSVLLRANGRSEFDGSEPTWTAKGRSALTVHHPWPRKDGTAWCLAITYEQHAEVTYGDNRRELNEQMKQRVKETRNASS